jgi:hypothetical protein
MEEVDQQNCQEEEETGRIGDKSRPVQRGVSKGVEDGRRLPALQAGHSQNGR